MASGLLISSVGDVAIVNFRNASILDGVAVDAISRALYALIDEQAKRKMVLDFTHVKFLSSTMLGVLLQLQKKSSDIDGKVVICGLRPQLYKVCKMMNLHKLLDFADDESAALGKFNIFDRP